MMDMKIDMEEKKENLMKSKEDNIMI